MPGTYSLIRPTERDGFWYYPPAKKCIYCGSLTYSEKEKSRNLGNEHIIPESLGGRFILPEASCAKCEGITSSFEGAAARTIFGPVRIHLNLPTKRPKDRPKTLPVLAYFGSEEEPKSVEIPVPHHPLAVAMVCMARPLFFRKSTGDEGDRRVTAVFLNGKSECDRRMRVIAEKLGARRIEMEGSIGAYELRLILAKIAHSLTCAIMPKDTFHPFLPELIRRKDHEALAMFVGGSPEPRNTTRDTIHVHDPYLIQKGNNLYAAVEIRLFASLGLPSYTAVVGRLYERAP
jgi:hypothetical protein